MELIDQTALITGGTAGIGLACARLLAREGTSVIITGRDAERRRAAAVGINVTSMVASKGVPGVPAYLASKAAVEFLTRTWAAEFGVCGVRSTASPGPTKTEGVEAEWGDTNDELGRALPLGRTAEPEEIAHAVLFLASPRSSFITGSTLRDDGGGTAI